MQMRTMTMHHPSFFAKDFLAKLDSYSMADFAKHVGLSSSEVDLFFQGKKDIDLSLAIRLGKFFKMTPQFWAYQQVRFDLNKFEAGLKK